MLQLQANKVVKDILEKQMAVKDEPQVLVYDRQSKLGNILADAYMHNMPKAQHIDFDMIDTEDIKNILNELPEGATVVLVQSRNFRIDDFRIRLNLFNRNIGCLEHTHLHYIKEEQYQTYINALEYRGDYYKDFGMKLAQRLEQAEKIEIESEDGSLLTFGVMEEAKINHGIFSEQNNRGGGALTGEVFSEAKDLFGVNGTLSIRCFPGEDLTIVHCEPFQVQIKNGFLFCDDPKCPELFRTLILDRIEKDEQTDGVMVREAGFGINPAISFKNDLADVNAFERMAGFHVSLGGKHQIYRKKLPKEQIQRYHIDVFADTKEIRIDGEVIYSNGTYLNNAL